MTTKYATGAEALQALTATAEGNASQSFAPFKSGSSYKVRVMDATDLITYFGYSIFKVVNTFVAESPSTLNGNGFAEKNLTLWDKASKHYSDLANKEQNDAKVEELRAEARLYRGKLRFVLAFIDLDTGTPIYLDLSKQQAQSVFNVIGKASASGKLGKKAFEIEKNGAGTSTTVTLSQLDLDDLNDKQQANYEKVGESFGGYNYDGLLYEADDAKQAEFLKQAGFDLSLIGYSAEPTQEAPTQSASAQEAPAKEEDLPF